jgi:oligopeptide transport system substrate-binding protein
MRFAPVLMAMALGGCGESGVGMAVRPIVVGTELAAQQELVRSLDNAPTALDPALVSDTPAFHVLGDLFEGLVAVGIDGKPVPGVASSWKVSDDGRSWVFHLRPDARWSNGKTVTAHDFIYAWRREIDPQTGAPYAQALAPIVNALDIASSKKPITDLGVESPDPRTLVIHLTAPTPYFLDILDQQCFYPLYEPTIQRWLSNWTRPEHMVSNGAFLLADNVLHGHIILARNPFYWDARNVPLEHVTYVPISDQGIHTMRFESGEVQFTYTFPSMQYAWLRSHLGDQAVASPYLGTVMLEFNVELPPFKDNLPLRRALSMAIDRDALARYLKEGLNVAATGVVPPLDGYLQGAPAWAQISSEERYSSARKLYREAGYSEKTPLRLNINASIQGSENRHVMEAVAAMWHQHLGADIGLDEREFQVLLQEMQLHTLPLYQFTWTGDYPDPLTFLELFSTGSQTNFSGYSNPDFDELLAKAQQEIDPGRRYQILSRAERMVNDDAISIPLFYYGSRHLIKPYLKGWQTNLMDRHPSRYMYLLQHSAN